MELGSGSTRENILDFSGDSNPVAGVFTGGGRGEGSERGAALWTWRQKWRDMATSPGTLELQKLGEEEGCSPTVLRGGVVLNTSVWGFPPAEW